MPVGVGITIDAGMAVVVVAEEDALSGVAMEVREDKDRGRVENDDLWLADGVVVAVGGVVEAGAGTGVVVALRDQDSRAWFSDAIQSTSRWR
ncbi:hypothetical protein MMC34_007268 [Xylographa carneopallida]|nr:hypothetical protein [Xylographa carneopallida]